MKIIILGGTQFTGRHLVKNLVTNSHRVILINRGKTNAGLFPEVKNIICPRESDEITDVLKKEGRSDAVIDMCAFFPKDVTAILPTLKDLTPHYIQISSISAYKSLQNDGSHFLRETDELHSCTPEQAGNTSMQTYGERKAECERVALNQSRDGVATTILRPSVIYGPYDPTDRFAYWIQRAAGNSKFMLPEEGLTIFQRTYAPDLAKVIVGCIGNSKVLHNAYTVMESEPLSLRLTLKMMGDHLGTQPLQNAVSVSAEKLAQMKVNPWSDVPLWLPHSHLQADTFKLRQDIKMSETPVKNALAEACTAFLALRQKPSAGLTLEKEQELLRLMHSVN